MISKLLTLFLGVRSSMPESGLPFMCSFLLFSFMAFPLIPLWRTFCRYCSTSESWVSIWDKWLIIYKWSSQFGEWMNVFFTARNEVGARLCFTRVCDSVHRGRRGLSQHALQVISQHALLVSRPTPSGQLEGSGLGGQLRGLARGGLQAHTQGVYPSMHWNRPPPSWRLLLRAVRILLECILVQKSSGQFNSK